MPAPRVLHLAGSPSSEFWCDLSRLYARDCLGATADRALQDQLVAYVTPDRRWRFPRDLSNEAIAAAPSFTVAEAVAHICALDVDAMLPQMFCAAGMTAYRALFDVLGIPYVGNRSETMALSANKARTKAVVAAAGIATPGGQVVVDEEPVAFDPPLIVKPVDSDNSAGVTLIGDRAALPAAVAEARRYSPYALVEEYIELGHEVRCGIVEQAGGLRCLPLEQYAVDAVRKPIRDHADKLSRDEGGELQLVAKHPSRAWIVDVEDPICAPVWAAARAAYRALGCRHYGLFDFRVDRSGRPWFLEAGLYCSFADQSVICTMARAAGLSAGDLLALGLSQALSERSPGRSLP